MSQKPPYYFGANSRRHLETCHPDITTIMNEVIQWFDCSILEGHRDHQLQREYLRRGLSKLGPGQSKHNTVPSLAWHAMPYFHAAPHIDWTHQKSMYALAGYILAVGDQLLIRGRIEHRVRWGGDWDRDFDVREKQWNDLAHYELVEPNQNFPHLDDKQE